MATITLSSGEIIGLRSRHLVGRSRSMHTRLGRADVSSQHAVISWMGGCWCIRDLGSRNGTRVNDGPVPAGTDQMLSIGDRIHCGTDGEGFVLSSADPPGPFALGPDTTVLGEDDALGIPNLDEPELLIQPDREGRWMAEGESGSRFMTDGETVVVGGVPWTLVLPESIAQTVERRDRSVRIADVALTFRVSRDEEFVEIDVTTPAGVHTLPARAHHYTTLTLARTRMSDAERGLPVAEQGWLHAGELQRMLKQSNARINLSLHRARRELESLDIDNPHDLFERRSTSRQIRIGVAHLSECALGDEAP